MAWGRSASSLLGRIGAPLAGLLAGIAAHAIHNTSMTLGAEFGWPCLIAFASDWGGVALLLGVLVWCSVRERRWIERWLGEEVERGTLSREDYEAAASHMARLVARAQALLSGDLQRWWKMGRYHRLVTELAFSKRRLGRFPDDEGAEERVGRLRAQVEEMTRDPAA
jgi:hypothetical protein